MYGARVYPRYLSGTGYALSAPTAKALYKAALTTAYFHLEDIYITGKLVRFFLGRRQESLVTRVE